MTVSTLMRTTAALTLLFVLAATALPQTPAADTAGKTLVKEGTEVPLKFSETISSKTAVADDKVNLELEKDLKIDKTVIAKAGTRAIGIVTNAKKAGSMGKAGELNLRLEYLIVGDTRLRLRASKSHEGQGKEGTAIALTVLFGPLGLLKKGKDIEIKTGTALKAFVDEDAWIKPLQ